MVKSYRQITHQLASQIRLVISDVDGTITGGDDSVSPACREAILRLQELGIVVGLASGRTLRYLEPLALHLGIAGPIIAENGGIAKLKVSDGLVDLGYSREYALQALEKLRTLFPGAVGEREEYQDRMVDVIIRCHGVGTEELISHLDNTQLLDSGYMLHLLQEGVSKGGTLMKLLERMEGKQSLPAEVMVIGDSLTDLSLFELFPHSVLIINPRHPAEQGEQLRGAAQYVSDLTCGEGFAEVAAHIATVCLQKPVSEL